MRRPFVHSARTVHGFVALSISSALMSCAMPAVAQAQEASDADATDDRLAEVVVTAQFKDQNVRDVPIAISAVTAEMLQERGQTSLTDLGQTSPGLAIRPSGQYGNATAVTIRGVGNFNALYGYEPGVG